MTRSSGMRATVVFLLLVAIVMGLSSVSTRLWGGKPEKRPDRREWVIRAEMTVGEFGQTNQLPNPVLKDIFGLQARNDLQNKLSQYGTPEQIKALVKKKLALAAEHASKNWFKIPVKFALWFAFLIGLFLFLRKRKLSRALRVGLLFTSVLVFGVIMGSDPSPMGT